MLGECLEREHGVGLFDSFDRTEAAQVYRKAVIPRQLMRLMPIPIGKNPMWQMCYRLKNLRKLFRLNIQPQV